MWKGPVEASKQKHDPTFCGEIMARGDKERKEGERLEEREREVVREYAKERSVWFSEV